MKTEIIVIRGKKVERKPKLTIKRVIKIIKLWSVSIKERILQCHKKL